MSLKIGLALAGGGGKGAYQIGVWKALDKIGLSKYITAVSGASVGALNCLLFAQGKIKNAERVWTSISRSDILSAKRSFIEDKMPFLDETPLRSLKSSPSFHLLDTISNKLFMANSVDKYSFSLCSREGLNEIIDRNIDLEKVSSSPLQLFACATKLPTGKVEYFKLNNQSPQKIKEIVFASSAFPVFYETQKINNSTYSDGGLRDNMPIKPLLNLGLDIIIAVYLKDKPARIPQKDFAKQPIFEIIPEEKLGHTFNFKHKITKSRIKQGEEDTLRAIMPIIALIKQIKSDI